MLENMVETPLRWFEHAERRPIDSLVRRIDWMEGSERQRKTMKTIRETIQERSRDECVG
jgi:hypothetical protein